MDIHCIYVHLEVFRPMKAKIGEWGNSNGLRITTPMLEHLNAAPGDKLELKMTDKGLEILKNSYSKEYVDTVAQEAITGMMESSQPVRTVEDPYAESDIHYQLIAINPCKPIIREVSKDTPNSFATLADAKEAARQIIQAAINEAKDSLGELRQVGVENITYIAL